MSPRALPAVEPSSLTTREVIEQAAADLSRRVAYLRDAALHGNEGIARLHLGAVASEASSFRRELERRKGGA